MPPSTEPSSVEADAHDERDARAVDDARVDVAAEMVGAEPVLRARRARASAAASVAIGVVGRELVGEDRGRATITSMSTPPAAPSGFFRHERGHERRPSAAGAAARRRPAPPARRPTRRPG